MLQREEVFVRHVRCECPHRVGQLEDVFDILSAATPRPDHLFSDVLQRGRAQVVGIVFISDVRKGLERLCRVGLRVEFDPLGAVSAHFSTIEVHHDIRNVARQDLIGDSPRAVLIERNASVRQKGSRDVDTYLNAF